jgi:hypothetical protein
MHEHYIIIINPIYSGLDSSQTGSEPGQCDGCCRPSCNPSRPAPKWCDWIEGSVGIKVNDNNRHYFRAKRKILHQCDPISPVLFIIVADMFAPLGLKEQKTIDN